MAVILFVVQLCFVRSLVLVLAPSVLTLQNNKYQYCNTTSTSSAHACHRSCIRICQTNLAHVTGACWKCSFSDSSSWQNFDCVLYKAISKSFTASLAGSLSSGFYGMQISLMSLRCCPPHILCNNDDHGVMTTLIFPAWPCLRQELFAETMARGWQQFLDVTWTQARTL